MGNNNSILNISFVLITLAILAAGVWGAVRWAQSLPSVSGEAVDTTAPRGFWAAFHRGQKVRLTPTPAPTEEELAAAKTETETAGESNETTSESSPADLETVIAAINTGGCTACHTIPGIPNAIGQVGPNLSNIGVDAATRREGYTAEEYIRESLKDPTAFTAPECPTGPCITGAMPVLQLDDAQIDTIVSYLTTLGVD